MAATKFSMVYLNEKTGNVLVNELSGKYTYKMATAIAKEVCERNEDLLITVVETTKMFPNGENERVTKIADCGWQIKTKELN